MSCCFGRAGEPSPSSVLLPRSAPLPSPPYPAGPRSSQCWPVADGEKGPCTGRMLLHSRAQGCPAAFQKCLGTHVTQPTVLLTRHSPACPWWHPAGTPCPRRSPSSCPSSTRPVSHLRSSLGFPWHKSLCHPRNLHPQPGESGMSLSPAFQIGSVGSHPGCSGWSSC